MSYIRILYIFIVAFEFNNISRGRDPMAPYNMWVIE